MIELIGYAFGSPYKSATSSCHNWYFQEMQLEKETSVRGETACVKKSIEINKNCRDLKEIERELFNKEHHCGNGIVESEFDEQCDCGKSSYATNRGNEETCNLKCCDMNTCRFRRETMQCARGSCCDENCLFKSSSHLCRDVKKRTDHTSTCDFVEYCSGESSQV